MKIVNNENDKIKKRIKELTDQRFSSEMCSAIIICDAILEHSEVVGVVAQNQKYILQALEHIEKAIRDLSWNHNE